MTAAPSSGGPEGERQGVDTGSTADPVPADTNVAGGAPGTKPSAPPKTRTGTAFKVVAAGAVVLVLLLVFILENTQSVKVSYFGATGHLALGVALLLAAVGGALLVALLGTARIFQLRRHAKHLR